MNLKKTNIIADSQTLNREYTYRETQIILLKILNKLTKELTMNKAETNCIRLYISYYNENIPSLKLTLNLQETTSSYSTIIKTVIKNYNSKVPKNNFIKKIGISFATATN